MTTKCQFIGNILLYGFATAGAMFIGWYVCNLAEWTDSDIFGPVGGIALIAAIRATMDGCDQ